ncbi:MAG: RHS repeat protein, partial [Chloroflexi bacterium]|nr:RHS repeat protein [Chloroflexota bacterium]
MAGGLEDTTTVYAYDAGSNLSAVTDARGNTTNFCYDVDYAGATLPGSRGNLTRRIDPPPSPGANRPVTLFQYDAKNNLIQTVPPLGVSSGAAVDCATNLSGSIDLRYATDLVYDAAQTTLLSAVRQATDPDLGTPTVLTTTFEYGDAANPGLVTRAIPPRGTAGPTPDYSYATSFAYGTSGVTAGVLLTTTDPLGNQTTYGYDAVGRRTSMVDPMGYAPGGVPAEHTWQWSYDGEDRVRFARTPPPSAGGAQLVTEYRYDVVGNREVVIDANGQVTRYGYDERDSLQYVVQFPEAWTDPAITPSTAITTEYQYDEGDNLKRVTRAKGDSAAERVVDYAYDGLN